MRSASIVHYAQGVGRVRASASNMDKLPPVPDQSKLEHWLRSPWRRRLLIVLATVLMAGVSTLLHGDAMASVGHEPDWLRLFSRRLLDWSWWALAAEPILWLGAWLSRSVRWWLPLVLIHAGLAYGTSRGLREADIRVSRELFVPPARADRADRMRREMTGRAGGDPQRGEFPGQRPPQQRGMDTRPGVQGSLPATEAQRRLEDRRRARRNLGPVDGPRLEYGMLIYLMILGVGWGTRTSLAERDQERRASEFELRAAILEGELTTARLASLEWQLHPHFLFNALHSVGGLVRSGDERAALTTLSALGGLLRATLEHGQEQRVTLGQELSLVEHYLEIERIRFGDRLKVCQDVEAGLSGAMVPALMLLPLVENAVKYGIAPRPEGGSLEIVARRQDAEITIEVRDDGPGFPESMLQGHAPQDEEHTSIGLANTRARLTALYPGSSGLELENLPGGGACARLYVPAEAGDGAPT